MSELKTRARQSNFECLRICAMFMIIFSHLMGQTGAIEATTGFNHLFAILAGSASRIGVALFVMIGSWFMAGNRMNASRILKVWCEVLFYTALITLVLFLLGYPVTTLQLISSFFPFLRRPLWFAGAYIALMLLSPFLNEVFSWEKSRQTKLLITMTIIVVIVSTTSRFMDTFLCNVFGFSYLYLLTGYYKFHIHNENKGKYKNIMFLSAFLVYLVIVLIKWYSSTMADTNTLFEYVYKLSTQYLSDFKSLPNLIISSAIFYYFSNTDMGSNKIINFMARSAFGVYIIHQTPAFINVLWNSIFKVNSWINSKYFVLLSVMTVLLIYIGGVGVDTIRVKFIEKPWVNSKWYFKLSNMLTHILRME